MATYETVIPVARPIEATFAFVSEFSNAAAWDPRTYAAERVTDGPVGVGTRFVLTGGGLREETVRRFRIPMAIASMKLGYDVVAFDPPHGFVLVGETAIYRYDDRIEFTSVGDETHVRYAASLELKGPFRVFDRLLARQFRRIGDEATAGLARAALAAGAGY